MMLPSLLLFIPFFSHTPACYAKFPCWLMPVFPPKATWVFVVWAAPRNHVHVSAPYWVGPTAHLWKESWPCLLWCGNKKAGHVPHVMGTRELILSFIQEWRQEHGCRRVGSFFTSHHTWWGGRSLAQTRLRPTQLSPRSRSRALSRPIQALTLSMNSWGMWRGGSCGIA